jgi:hypothetical protein
MCDILDLDRYPIDRPELPTYSALVQRCQADLTAHGGSTSWITGPARR